MNAQAKVLFVTDGDVRKCVVADTINPDGTKGRSVLLLKSCGHYYERTDFGFAEVEVKVEIQA